MTMSDGADPGRNASAPLLLCLPQAGAGPGVFRPWNGLGASGVEVHPIVMPGRERKLFDPPYTDVQVAVADIADELRPLLAGRAIALFGHCLGALQCFELARRLRRDGCEVTHLVVSGSRPPDHARARRATGLVDDERFLAELERIAGYRDPAMDDPELRALMMPAIRADVQMDEDYRTADRTPLDVPVTAVRGGQDEIVTADELAGWRSWTTTAFEVVEFPGGHMYFTHHADALVRLATTVPAQGGVSRT
jgi:surfactin synthase thioesterase subunit